jgi:hypothetical protein
LGIGVFKEDGTILLCVLLMRKDLYVVFLYELIAKIKPIVFGCCYLGLFIGGMFFGGGFSW